ncbi:hypothetical protein BD779DRAFT_1668378 [Infundibulicybe gibba]|nr:hypothetical protein BD779DRAFT_1668378 [Infundibulicybe gibba]
MVDIQLHTGDILTGLYSCTNTHSSTLRWAQQTAQEEYTRQLEGLTREDAGLRFSAAHATNAQLVAFDLEDVGEKMKEAAPGVWKLFDDLLSANSKTNTMHKRNRVRRREAASEIRGAGGPARERDGENDGDEGPGDVVIWTTAIVEARGM